MRRPVCVLPKLVYLTLCRTIQLLALRGRAGPASSSSRRHCCRILAACSKAGEACPSWTRSISGPRSPRRYSARGGNLMLRSSARSPTSTTNIMERSSRGRREVVEVAQVPAAVLEAAGRALVGGAEGLHDPVERHPLLSCTITLRISVSLRSLLLRPAEAGGAWTVGTCPVRAPLPMLARLAAFVNSAAIRNSVRLSGAPERTSEPSAVEFDRPQRGSNPGLCLVATRKAGFCGPR